MMARTPTLLVGRIALVLGLGLAACGSGDNQGTGDAGTDSDAADTDTADTSDGDTSSTDTGTEPAEEKGRADFATLTGEATSEADLAKLVEWMTGAFESKDKAGQKEPEGFYTYIWADLKQIRIWPEKTDGYWLYLEQSEHGQAPYRTRIYNVRLNDGTTYVVDNYKIPYGAYTDYEGAFDDPSLFDGLDLATIATHNAECNVTIKKHGAVFYGMDNPETCLANMGSGDLKMDSFSIIREGSFYSHDMGFDPASGEQMIGPTSVGYTFTQLEDYPI